MVLAIAAVTALAWWDDQREANAALQDLETQQTVVASSLAARLEAHLPFIERDATRVAEAGGAGPSDPYSPAVVQARGGPPSLERTDPIGPNARRGTRACIEIPIAASRGSHA
jgi:hypothetical protein